MPLPNTNATIHVQATDTIYSPDDHGRPPSHCHCCCCGSSAESVLTLVSRSWILRLLLLHSLVRVALATRTAKLHRAWSTKDCVALALFQVDPSTCSDPDPCRYPYLCLCLDLVVVDIDSHHPDPYPYPCPCHENALGGADAGGVDHNSCPSCPSCRSCQSCQSVPSRQLCTFAR